MTNISWTEGVPSGTSAVGDTPSVARNIWNAINTGLSTNLYWAGSGNSIGQLKPGASRAFYDVQSNSSNSNDATMRARAFLASDTSRLFVYESNGTYLAGTPYLVEMTIDPNTYSGTSRCVWIKQNGFLTWNSGVGTTAIAVNFAKPFITLPQTITFTCGTVGDVAILEDYNASGFTVGLARINGTGAGTNTIYWAAVGVADTTAI